MGDGFDLDGYTFDRCVRATPQSAVWLGRRDVDGLAVMGKRYAGRPERARREMEVLQQLDSPLVLEPLALEASNEGPVLVTRYFDGWPVTKLFEDEPYSTRVFLSVARKVALALGVVHEGRLIHKDISPGNVLVSRDATEVCLIDFGLAQRFGRSLTPGQMSSSEEGGTLLYMSPEQTGRMDRGIDFRSDLYSLGAVFYHVVSGRPPFECADTLELVHAHFAKPPGCPTEHNPSLPKTLARIILKLLEKEPSRRYQTARSLAADLEQCERELALHGELRDGLRLGSADVPDRPVFGSALYGAGAALEQLCAGFSEAAAGDFALCVIEGPAGTGKSALVDALRATASESRGLVAVGGFQAYGSEQPCLGWVAALSSLAQQLLVESDKEFKAHRARIEARLQALAPVITDFVPELAFVLGEHPAPPALDADQTSNRLCQAVSCLLAGYCSPETPLVLVLEDVQWMDAASAALLAFVVDEARVPGLQIIATLREDGQGTRAGSPLAGLLEAAGERARVVRTAPLDSAHVEQMLCAALDTTPDRARGLVGHVSTKTGNVPLLVRQFVSLMVDQGAIRYRHPGGWIWDEAAIAAADIADDAVGLMRQKIDALDPQLERVLAYASVIGREFDVESLATLSEIAVDEIEAATLALDGTGLISVCAAGFRFSHDRIREAAHAALPEAERARLHRRMGRMLLAATPAEQVGARIFSIADHLNQGAIADARERAEVFELNLRAARQALLSGAPDAAVAYVEHADARLDPEVRESDAAKFLELSLLGCEAAAFAGDFARALAWIEPLSSHRFGAIDEAKIASWRLRIFAVTRHPREAVEHMLSVARRFGVRWPIHPSRWRIVWAQVRTEWILRKRGCDDLFLPPGPNPAIPILLLTGPSGGPMSRTDAGLSALASCLAVGSYARYGFIARPAFSLIAYASFLLLYSPFPARAARYLAMFPEWNARVATPPFNTRGEVLLHISVAPWLAWRRKSIDPLRALAGASRDVGDFEHVAYALFLRALLRAFVGEPIQSCGADFAEAAAALRKGQLYPEPISCLRAFEHLSGEGGPPDLDAAVLASEEFAREHPALSRPYAATVFMMVACVLGRPDIASAQSDRVWEDLLRDSPFIHVPDHFFYRGLAAAQMADGAKGGARRRLRKRLGECSRWLARRAELGPDFVHMALFLAAEREQLRGREERARALYRGASERAQQANYPHHIALVYERWAAFERRARRPSQSIDLLRRASAKYELWGATHKVAALADR